MLRRKVESMDIKLTRTDNTLDVALQGRVDVKTTSLIEEALEGKLGGIEELVFDFEQVSYLSSAGLRMLALFQDAMDETDATLRVVKVRDEVMNVFQMTHFTDFIDISQ